MKPEHLARLFEPFFSTKTDRGTGLGLALSKKIIERHSGNICARSSTRAGRSGTAFRIALPHTFNSAQGIK
jgi:signal transduction histidine kinase